MFKNPGFWPLLSIFLIVALALTGCMPALLGAAQNSAPTATPAPAESLNSTPAFTPTAPPAATNTPAAISTAAVASTPIGAPTVTPLPGSPIPVTGATGKIAILLPDKQATRYEKQDLPFFKARLASLGFDVKTNLIYANAEQDSVSQQAQAGAALDNGAKVLVVDPVDPAAAAAIANQAQSQGVPVISYDRLIAGSDAVSYYISADNVKIGQLQAQSLMTSLQGKSKPVIVMMNGSPMDSTANLIKQGAHSVFDPLVSAGQLTIGKEYDTPSESTAMAQDEMNQALIALGKKIDGVYAASDSIAAGAIAALKAAGINPLPPVTGRGAELPATQRIITGEQVMTVYSAIKPEAEDAATLAYDLLSEAGVPSDIVNGTTNNGKIDVPSVLLDPVVVTRDGIQNTIIADELWTAQQICTANLAAACKAIGIQ